MELKAEALKTCFRKQETLLHWLWYSAIFDTLRLIKKKSLNGYFFCIFFILNVHASKCPITNISSRAVEPPQCPK